MEDKIVKKITGISAYNSEDLSVDYERCGRLIRKQLDKEVIKKKGPYVSIGFQYEEEDNITCMVKKPEVILSTFKNNNGVYSRFSYFKIKNKEEAKKVICLLNKWFNLEDK